MTSPRNRTDHVTAPVLFRLPNLHARDAAYPVEQPQQQAAPATAERVAEPATPVDSRQTVPNVAPAPSLASTVRSIAASQLQPASLRVKAALSNSLPRREILAKPPVVLGAMLVVAFGSWLAGRQMSPRPAVDVAVADASAAVSTGGKPQGNVAIDLNAPYQTQPAAPSDAAPVQQPALSKEGTELAAVANVVDDFYIPEDMPTPELSPAIAAHTADVAGADESGGPSPTIALQAATEEIAAAIDPAERFAGLSSDILNQPTDHPEVAASETAAPPEDKPEPAEASPESTQLSSTAKAAEPPDAETPEPSETKEAKKPRRVLSRTPHDIPDWSKYLSGADGTIRAASAQRVNEQAGAPQPKTEHAFYYEQD